MSEIRCRFSPSPTGQLHIGGARTAIINYLYAKQTNGQMLLRIEDTDLERSKPEYIQTIFDSLKWLGITYDGEPVIQSKNLARHTQVANDMLLNNTAYKCFCSSEELDAHRDYCTKN